MDWIDLAQDSDRWPPLLNAILNVRVQIMWGISCIAEEVQEGGGTYDLF